MHAVPPATLKLGTHVSTPPTHAWAPVWQPFDVVHAVAATLSTTPSQLSSIPLHTSATGAPAVALHVVLIPLQITAPVRAQAPTPTVQLEPVGRHVPPQLL